MTHDARQPGALTVQALLALYGGAVAVRALALVASHGGVPDGDWPVYARVAGNILNGCGVSLSVPGQGECVPHFGGNGLPGYPAFVAAVWAVTAHTKAAVQWAQVFAASVSVPVLARAAAALAGRRAGMITGVVMAVSPLQASLVRYGGAESLSVAAAALLLAALLLSIKAGRLRVLPVAAWLGLGIFLRLDFIAFALPVAVVGIALEGVARAAWRGTVLAALLCVPLGAWTARNVTEAVPVLPPARGWMLPDGSVGPLGYKAWLAQWVTNADQRAAAMFFDGDHYDEIQWRPGPFRDADQDAAAAALLYDLRKHSGHPFPADIDTGFAALARQAAARHGVSGEIALRVAQALGFWQSWAELLPPDARPPGEMSARLMLQWLHAALSSGIGSMVNVVTRFYRLVLGAGLVGAILAWPCWGRTARVVLLAGLGLVVAKTVIGVVGLFIEPRYTLTAVPAIELALALCAALSRQPRPHG